MVGMNCSQQLARDSIWTPQELKTPRDTVMRGEPHTIIRFMPRGLTSKYQRKISCSKAEEGKRNHFKYAESTLLLLGPALGKKLVN